MRGQLAPERIRPYLLKGQFGLEKESLRVTGEGHFAQTPHPLPDHPHITRDFCENQTEINTGVHGSPEGAVGELVDWHRQLCRILKEREEPEYLWPFSNSPYIENAGEIPVAVFTGGRASKTDYRDYLANRYGKYKMTFSGIHVNYSFSEELLEEWAREARLENDRAFRDALYLHTAEQLLANGWLINIVTAASPVTDSSFLEAGETGGTWFSGMASVRCSELGYWNEFIPLFRFDSAATYAESIERYVNMGYLQAPTELYFPIRLKPKGLNRLQTLVESGVNHLELRMYDLNPFEEACIELRDVAFAQLLIMYLACQERRPLTGAEQILMVQNYKHSAHYDLSRVQIHLPGGSSLPAREAGLLLMEDMREFYRGIPGFREEVLDFEADKLLNPSHRYACRARETFGEDFVRKGLRHAMHLPTSVH